MFETNIILKTKKGTNVPLQNTVSLIRFRVSISWMAYTSITTKAEDPSNMTTMDLLDRSTATKRIECPLVFGFEIKGSVWPWRRKNDY